MENWDQYFSLKPAAEPMLSDSGELKGWEFSYGVFLKPAYAENYISGQVDFEMQFETERRRIAIEETTGTYELGEQVGTSLESDFRQKTFSLRDFRDWQSLSIKSDFYQSVAAQAYCGATAPAEDGTLVAELPTNGKILHAEGSLTLKS